ncbi:MAG: hypothetical protein Q9183_007644 [Haloplaca sp. 2 TL-2023]
MPSAPDSNFFGPGPNLQNPAAGASSGSEAIQGKPAMRDAATQTSLTMTEISAIGSAQGVAAPYPDPTTHPTPNAYHLPTPNPTSGLHPFPTTSPIQPSAANPAPGPPQPFTPMILTQPVITKGPHATVNPRKYKCDWPGCGQGFSRPRSLEGHKNGHLKSTPYACKFGCPKTFAASTSTKRRHEDKCDKNPKVVKEMEERAGEKDE